MIIAFCWRGEGIPVRSGQQSLTATGPTELTALLKLLLDNGATVNRVIPRGVASKAGEHGAWDEKIEDHWVYYIWPGFEIKSF